MKLNKIKFWYHENISKHNYTEMKLILPDLVETPVVVCLNCGSMAFPFESTTVIMNYAIEHHYNSVGAFKKMYRSCILMPVKKEE